MGYLDDMANKRQRQVQHKWHVNYVKHLSRCGISDLSIIVGAGDFERSQPVMDVIRTSPRPSLVIYEGDAMETQLYGYAAEGGCELINKANRNLLPFYGLNAAETAQLLQKMAEQSGVNDVGRVNKIAAEYVRALSGINKLNYGNLRMLMSMNNEKLKATLERMRPHDWKRSYESIKDDEGAGFDSFERRLCAAFDLLGTSGSGIGITECLRMGKSVAINAGDTHDKAMLYCYLDYILELLELRGINIQLVMADTSCSQTGYSEHMLKPSSKRKLLISAFNPNVDDARSDSKNAELLKNVRQVLILHGLNAEAAKQYAALFGSYEFQRTHTVSGSSRRNFTLFEGSSSTGVHTSYEMRQKVSEDNISGLGSRAAILADFKLQLVIETDSLVTGGKVK